MARPTLCIDTDLLIDFLRNRGAYAKVLEAAVERYRCALPSITVYEVCFGIERTHRQADWHSLQRLLSVMEVLPFDLAAARASARIDVQLQRAGIRLNFPDLFIAGICVAKQMPLLTRNVAHFSRVPRLKLLNPQHFT